MSRYYEESEIMKALDSNLVGTYYGLVLNVNMDEFLDGVPTADVVEVKRGEWIQHVNEPNLWSCSICETVIYSEHDEDRLKFHKWCGCCGADMRGEK